MGVGQVLTDIHALQSTYDVGIDEIILIIRLEHWPEKPNLPVHGQDPNAPRTKFKHVRTHNGEFYVDDVLNQNIKDGLNVKVFEVENYICWGTPNDYKTYNYWNKYFNKIKNKNE